MENEKWRVVSLFSSFEGILESCDKWQPVDPKIRWGRVGGASEYGEFNRSDNCVDTYKSESGRGIKIGKTKSGMI